MIHLSLGCEVDIDIAAKKKLLKNVVFIFGHIVIVYFLNANFLTHDRSCEIKVCMSNKVNVKCLEQGLAW